MATIKKRKLKLKKKNFCILILSILIIIFSINLTISLLTSNKSQNKLQKKEKTELEKKLDTLENINKNLDFFKIENIDRYIEYKNKNKDLDIEKIITHVNMGIDYDYYTNTQKSTDLNKSYILVNKYNYLTEDYIPNNLQKISLEYARSGMTLIDYAKEAFEEMAKAAKKEKLSIIATSSYRDYKYQVDLYNRYVKTDGKEAADTYSARPGFSEHQTGLAVDIYNGKETYTDFEKTKEFTWMQENAHLYGFILRFPKDKVKETGYQYESWHYRYVGKKIAKYIKENNISLEEYYIKFIDNKQNTIKE
ncbi:MAG: M15 family metallopeptidase [Bacilli bacterium]|nr:M15 family metallopeptidase [Bacilli bacterium]